MSATMNAEKILNTGLRNLWYPIAPSWQVQTHPVGVTRLGERLVMWRDAGGRVHALEDRCPHRGARLSLGWNLGDQIACWYHGVQIDGTGTVRRVPAFDNCPLEGQKAVRAYPVHESNGGIFAWFGDELHREPAELVLPEEMTGAEYDGFLCTALWRCNYRYAIDNVMDPMHGAYLHAESHSMSGGDKSARMRMRATPTGFIFEKEDQQGINFDRVEFGNTGAQWLKLALPYRPNAGPGGHFWVCSFVTPVDERTCQVYFWRIRKVQGWQRDLWRFLFRTRLEGKHWAVLEQDRALLESMAEDARDHEFLYQHDTGLARLRRLMETEAKAQADALAAHATTSSAAAQ
jgi:phenylpropionate dioxygenase-like ring-hydroxylating dioxygenase large terminal subunit